MKKFLKHLLFFLLPMVLSSYFIDIFISSNLRKSSFCAYGEYHTWNAIIDGKINADIVIYGSSRASVNINPSMIRDSLHIPAYNLGIDGHNFWLQYLRHSMLLEKNPKPKLIIYSLDMFTLEKRKELYNYDQFLPYMLWNSEIRNATISYKGFSLFDYEIPLLRYFGKRSVIDTAINLINMQQNNNTGRILGYQGQDRSWNSDLDNAKKEIQFYEAKLNSASINLFERFLIECKKNSIKIIFLYTPEYIEGQKFVKNRSEIIGLYIKFSKKYDIPFYDYSNDSMSFNKKYFYNSSHLNKTGAELFTNKLISKIDSAYNCIKKHDH